MGNKNKLLSSIVPEIEKLTNEGDTVCDLMAGTNSIGYALKERNKIISNDIQFYSFVIGSFMLGNIIPPNTGEAHLELDDDYDYNFKNKNYSFFVDNYTDTYFSGEQCLEIDSFRYAIEKAPKEHKMFYLTVLMSVMCKAQSTTGHFAQYMDKSHKRIIPLRALSIYKLFFEKIDEFKDFVVSKYDNVCFNLDFNDLLKNPIMKEVKCIYVDSPYTSDQYSRFYHVLETICKYDNPVLEHKAKYRNDRAMSDFCYKKTVAAEFEKIISFGFKNNSSIVISYSNHGVIPPEQILDIGKKYYKNCEIKYLEFEHSSQGKGTIEINEVVIILK